MKADVKNASTSYDTQTIGLNTKFRF